MSKETKKRIIWLDLLKAWLIILVVNSHSGSADLYTDFYSPFFLTTFFVIAGYNFSYNNINNFIKEKSIRLLGPLFLIGTLKIFGAYIISKINVLDRFIGLVLQKSCQNDDLWFIACMFSAVLLYFFVNKITTGIGERLILCFLLYGMGFYVISVLNMKLVMQFETALIMNLFLCYGSIYRKYENYIENNDKRKFFDVAIVIIYIMLIYKYNLKIDIHREIYSDIIIFFITSSIIIIPIIDFFKMTEKIFLKKYIEPISIIGGNTILIYCLQNYIIKPYSYFYRLFGIKYNPYIDSWICTIITVIVLSYVSHKIKIKVPLLRKIL